MARRSRKRNKNIIRQTREIINFATPRVRLSPLLPPALNLKTYEDRRTYHPEPSFRPAFGTKRSATRLITPAPPTRAPNKLPSIVRFAEPAKVLICIRRRVRKRVIAAIGIAGSKVRKGRRNAQTGVSC